jgi:hypothetical protein
MAQGGLLTVIQRSSGDMRLNPHLHVVALDGAYVAGPDGQPALRELDRLKTSEVADVFQITKVRVLKALERRGVVRVSSESLEVDDVLSARAPVLAQLAAAAVAGLPPAGPAERKRAPYASRWTASLRFSASSWRKTADSTCTPRLTPVPLMTRPALASCATSCARHFPKSDSPCCPSTASV